MAGSNISSIVFTCFLFICLKAGHARERREAAEAFYHHAVKISSLLPEDSCRPSSRGQKLGASLEVVHRYGPCSRASLDKDSIPTHSEILQRDQARVDSIHSRVTLNGNKVLEKDVTIPAKSGSTIGSGNYIVTLGFGTPTKDLSLIFDTGSDFTWIQCQPCVRSCYQQAEPIFDPRQSSTYTNISCTSATCASLVSATSVTPGCSSSTCVYGIQYGDSSFSVGFFATEKLTLANDVFSNYLFGCGENNQGLFGGSAGLLGLGKGGLSAVSQTASKYGRYFSYCLPSTRSNIGHLTFGNDGTSPAEITQILTSSQGPSFYFVNIQAISVGGQQLSISPTVFSTAGTVVDSGTVITRLPPAAYTALRSAFRQRMSQYPTAAPLAILDTCYDLSGYSTVSVPKISISFAGGAVINLDLSGILYVQSISRVCLAFAGNSDASDLGILGNVQQRTFDVIYDVAGGSLDFGLEVVAN
ncbi:hypothetical protein Nepgr_001147 [Nepenthes gracilis]|uniref:Peptidase A1 domain-containing protein n=1 Tax=Nepenthes gracilis TaxID=150966 RepID=A0AAD3P4P2_NEPGR|nr:hypothetical protein Nepgr_001147 [Nepenthes gracilis]